MDFRYQLDGQLRTPMSRALQDVGEKYVDAVKVRAAEDTWRPSNLQTAYNLGKVLSELDDLGIALPEFHVTNECWIPLTSNTLAFSKLYVGLLEDCLNVATPELLSKIEDVLVSVMRTQVQHLLTSLTNSKLKQEVQDLLYQFIFKNRSKNENQESRIIIIFREKSFKIMPPIFATSLLPEHWNFTKVLQAKTLQNCSTCKNAFYFNR